MKLGVIFLLETNGNQNSVRNHTFFGSEVISGMYTDTPNDVFIVENRPRPHWAHRVGDYWNPSMFHITGLELKCIFERWKPLVSSFIRLSCGRGQGCPDCPERFWCFSLSLSPSTGQTNEAGDKRFSSFENAFQFESSHIKHWRVPIITYSTGCPR